MRLEQTLKPTQTITPQMIQTMTILQYGAQELAEYLGDLACENPLVELQEPDWETSSRQLADQLRWLQRSDRQNLSYYRDDRDETRYPIPAVEDRTLQAYLREQALALSLPAEQARALETIIGLLDGHGFFDGDISEAAELARCSREAAADALDTLRQMDPPGVGAGDLQECLLFQLQHMDGDTEAARRLIAEQYRALPSKTPDQLAAALHIPPRDVTRALALISTLTPYPADGFADQEAIVYIRPDLYVVQEGSALAVYSNDAVLPEVSVNVQYLHMLETEPDPEVQQYLRKKLRQLQQVMHGLGNRKSTVLRCGEILAVRQQAFFLGGELQKLTLRDVAEEMEVHESTVSRTVKNKYIQCARGIFPMGSFFSRSAGQNANLCRENVLMALRQLLEDEDRSRPCSDEQLSRLLGRQNIILSRRAVAKYRAELGYPTAHMRKAPGKSV